MSTSTRAGMFPQGFSAQRCPVTRELMPNVTRNFNGFHISYCRHSTHYGSDTTALVLQGRVFFILNGCHAEAMSSAAESHGLRGGIDFFIAHIHLASAYSEHRMAVGMATDLFELMPLTLEMIGREDMDRLISALAEQ